MTEMLVDGATLFAESRAAWTRAYLASHSGIVARPMLQIIEPDCSNEKGDECDMFPYCSGDAFHWTPELLDVEG